MVEIVQWQVYLCMYPLSASKLCFPIPYSFCQDEDGSTRGAYPSVLNAAQGDPGVMWNYYEHDADLQYKATIKRGLFTTFQWDLGDGSIMTCSESMSTIF